MEVLGNGDTRNVLATWMAAIIPSYRLMAHVVRVLISPSLAPLHRSPTVTRKSQVIPYFIDSKNHETKEVQ